MPKWKCRLANPTGQHDLLFCLPSCRTWPDLCPGLEDVYIRASDGLVAHPVAGYHYQCQLGNLHWVGIEPRRAHFVINKITFPRALLQSRKVGFPDSGFWPWLSLRGLSETGEA
jgi:hypothetical protein